MRLPAFPLSAPSACLVGSICPWAGSHPTSSIAAQYPPSPGPGCRSRNWTRCGIFLVCLARLSWP
ncbi:hypothetical protein BCR44DRAFT_1438544 [Catenaria anguillulae PL171]|uniref:Uncharacterized protein n=1 Tax=Catenaria anguillulae PL171 TaxID=765915 RepID=A0A1Y2HGT5_9FUNG|nr:hypothetical protein BCR44DRAFT_1438544 [Catenaria anguillulae PL171]